MDAEIKNHIINRFENAPKYFSLELTCVVMYGYLSALYDAKSISANELHKALNELDAWFMQVKGV